MIPIRCWTVAGALAGVALGSPAWAIAPGTLDTFEDAATGNWSGATTGVQTGGPAGAGDHYLSAGQDSFRPHLAIKNSDDRWAGDYAAAGVTQLEVDIKVFIGPALQMRAVLFGGNFGSEATSTTPIAVPADGAWHHLTFDIGPGALTTVSGFDTPGVIRGAVSTLMFRQQSGPPAHGGDFITATVGFDNIKAGPVPITIAQWRSVRTHGPAGDLSIVLNPSAAGNGMTGPTCESRQNGIQNIQVDFSSGPGTVSAGAVTVTGRSTVGGILQAPVVYTPTSVGMISTTTLRITFAPGLLPDQTCYTIDIAPAGVPGLTGDHDVSVRSIAGDTTGSGGVNLSDALATQARIAAAVAGNPQFDVDLSGVISLADALAAKAALGRQALCP